MSLPLSTIRQQFPILGAHFHGKPLVYLDTAATAQKPQAVLDAMDLFYKESNANPHRGMHVLAERATVAYEQARASVQKFLNAKRPEEIVFTKNCTEAINLVAKTFGKTLKEGDSVVLSLLEHHSNIVPWLQLKEERGIDIHWIDIDDEGNLKLEMLDTFLAEKNVKLVAVTGQSNVMGTITPLKEIIAKAHAAGALVLVDAAQLVTHRSIDVQKLDCDFLAFSSHKIYGPTGIGVLYGKLNVLQSLPPFLGGGMMIQEVFEDRFSAADAPARFEAGSQPIAEAIGLEAALNWLDQFDEKDRISHESLLLSLAQQELSSIPGLLMAGPRDATKRAGCISFMVEGVHPHDLTDLLGREGICLRAGHHCTQPLHRRLGITATSRLSLGIYNTEEEIRMLKPAIVEAMKILK